MSGRPWYVKAADVTHRTTVLGIIGFSGYLGYGIYRQIMQNYHKKQAEIGQRSVVVDDQTDPSKRV